MEKNLIHWYREYHRWEHHYFVHWQALIVVLVVIALGISHLQSVLKQVSEKGEVLASTTTSVTVSAGSLSLSAPASTTLSAVTLAASAQTSTGSVGSTIVTDNRGSGAGWTLSATLSHFTCCTPTRTITVTNLTITPGSVTTNAGTANATGGSAHTFTTTTDATTLMSAGTDQGMGQYTINPSLSLSVPVGSYAGAYTATITTTVS